MDLQTRGACAIVSRDIQMTRTTRYPISEKLPQICQMLRIDIRNVMRRLGLPPDYCDQPGATISADNYFSIWDAVEAEADRPNCAMELGIAYAHGPFAAPLFAFSCSENLEKGLTRLGEFKPLLGPMTIRVERVDGAVEVTVASVFPEIRIPDGPSLFELTYLVECVRTYTNEHIVPLVAYSPAALQAAPVMVEHLGLKITEAPETKLVFSQEDAQRPFITRSDILWETLEPTLRQRLAVQHKQDSMRARVKAMLWETLAGGANTSEQIARRLHVSKRSMQRRLSEEGVSFKEVLTETRAELSEHYLRQNEISLAEIAFLVGFRDPTSFFRAFQSWTGKTPMEARRALVG